MNTEQIEALKALAEKARGSGDWLSVDRTVYALEHHGWRKGEELMRNRFFFNVQRGPEFDDAACAQLAQYCAAANPAAILELLASATASEARLAEYEAARFAYASEFPLSADGEPDVGSIHANIRALKKDATASEGRIAEQASRIEFLEATLTLMTKWLEANKLDVFSRGIWDAINERDRPARAALAGSATPSAKPDEVPALIVLRAQVQEMHDAAYTFGDHSKEAVRTALDCVTDAIDLFITNSAQPDTLKNADSEHIVMTKRKIHDIAKDASERVARNARTAPQLCYAPIRSAIEDHLADIIAPPVMDCAALADILAECASDPVPALSEQEMKDICTARGWGNGDAPSFRDIALVFWVNGALAERNTGRDAVDAKRWRLSMDWQDRSDQPESILAMWRKVYAEHRLKPAREEYEAAIDAAIASMATKAPAMSNATEGGDHG